MAVRAGPLVGAGPHTQAHTAHAASRASLLPDGLLKPLRLLLPHQHILVISSFQLHPLPLSRPFPPIFSSSPSLFPSSFLHLLSLSQILYI